MADSPDTATTMNGVSDPLKRLASIKPPRDLSLGGAKPNKKIFTPNLNVTRNKSKGPIPNLREFKQDDKGKRERRNNRNKNFKNGPNIIKSTGVFSEGLGSAERQSSRSSHYSRGSAEPTSALQKPTIRVKDVIKIDKELEDQKINGIVGVQGGSEIESEDFKHVLDVDAPIKLPMDEGGWAHSQTKVPLKIKQEVIVKQEPADDIDCPIPETVVEETKPDVKEAFEDTNVVNLLGSDKPTLILLQLPDSLPGRGGSGDDEPLRRKPAQYGNPSTPSTSTSSSTSESTQEKRTDNRCRLTDLEEGRIGKLLVRRSGRVTFALGDTMFEVCSGTKAAFHQEVVSVAVDEPSRSANLIALGSLQHKLNITPDWESMFSNMTV